MLRAGHMLALCAIALLSLGLVMVCSADMAVTRVTGVHPVTASPTFVQLLTSRTAVYFFLALLMLAAGAFVPIRAVAAWADGHAEQHGQDAGSLRSTASNGLFPLGLGVIVLLAVCGTVYIPGLARVVNGSRRWIAIAGIGDSLSIQPSELAKWGVAGLIALYAARGHEKLGRFWAGLVPGLLAAGAVAGFIVLEDLGTGVLIGAVASLVLLAGGAKWWHFVCLSPIPILGVVAAIITSDYRVARIMAFVDPYKDPEGIGYHTIQSLHAVAGGGGFGRGLGFGVQKLGYLPEDRTDFLFAVLCEELGIAGAALVVVLFVGLVWSGLGVIQRESSRFLRLLALGVVMTVGVQAVINLFVVTAMAPTKGIALPLISSGGTGWMLTAFSLGVVIAIDRTARGAGPELSLFQPGRSLVAR